ncbi:MAG: DUF3551 domain-containing protein [Xanthobacteraceae bacterium]
MRLISAALAVGAFGLFASIHSANAEITYPWCAQYGDPDGTRNCGFSRLDQCRAAISGNGGYCEQNPMYRPAVENPTPRKPRR